MKSPDAETLGTSQVAELLDVHPSTVKRWSDAGDLNAARTDGGHRRFRLDDVLQAARMQSVPTFLDPFAPYEPHVWRAVEDVRSQGAFGRVHALAMGWISRGHHERVGGLFEMLGRHPDIPFPLLLDDGVGGFMARVGDSWREGRLRVGEEHLASQTLIEALLRLRPKQAMSGPSGRDGDGARPKRAVVGSTDGDQHHLGALCVRLVLEREGWETLYLGPSVPVEDFASVQRARKANLVCISVAPSEAPNDPLRCLRTLEGLYDRGSPYALALGGGGVGSALSGRGGRTGPFEDLAAFDGCAPFIDALRGGFGQSRSSQSVRAAFAYGPRGGDGDGERA